MQKADKFDSFQVGDEFTLHHPFWKGYHSVKIIRRLSADRWDVQFTDDKGKRIDRQWTTSSIQGKFFPPYGSINEVTIAKRIISSYE